MTSDTGNREYGMMTLITRAKSSPSVGCVPVSVLTPSVLQDHPNPAKHKQFHKGALQS